MKFLLFDYNAINELIEKQQYQSVDFALGERLVDHICGIGTSEIIDGLAIEYVNEGVLFIGKRRHSEQDSNAQIRNKIFCFDLNTCNVLSEKDNKAILLSVFQKSFRTALKIWDKQPFSVSERVYETKSILFPFSYPNKRRLVIERSNNVPRLASRGIDFPLLAYKYSSDDAPQGNEEVDTSVLRDAGEVYASKINAIQIKLQNKNTQISETQNHSAMRSILTRKTVDEEGFVYFEPDMQYDKMTKKQKYIVDYDVLDAPLRIEGAAGTGKTVSLLLRAHKILEKKAQEGSPFSIIFITHSDSTNKRCREIFELYPHAEEYLNTENDQKIMFSTLLDFCCTFTQINKDMIIEKDAGDAKTYQLFLIDNVLDNCYQNGRYKTYKTLLSERMNSLFSDQALSRSILVSMLQHEFSVQIKGRTNGRIEEYYDLPSITNGIPCENKHDKDFIHALFRDYQRRLQSLQYFDVDDVVMESLSRLNAPIWRRERKDNGYDYIIVDEMHLFNINEQSVFHYLSKNPFQTDVPICFALDYNQAIGDRGHKEKDYIEKAFGGKIEKQKLNTVFRNSPQIAEFCAAIAASGTLMFQESFVNPYTSSQSGFTGIDEKKFALPELHMYADEDHMIDAVGKTLEKMMKDLQCKPNEIAIITFDQKYDTDMWAEEFSNKYGKTISVLKREQIPSKECFVLTSPNDINGLEFAGVILLGVDDGRVPQTAGTNDISQHFIQYSAYNMLYLSASRAKYRLAIMGNQTNGLSPCLGYAIKQNYIETVES